MEENKKSDPSQTLIPYKKSKEISRLQVKQAETASLAKAARLGTGCCRILVPTAREYRRLQVENIRARDKSRHPARKPKKTLTSPIANAII